MKIALHYQSGKEFLCNLDEIPLHILFSNMSLCCIWQKNKT